MQRQTCRRWQVGTLEFTFRLPVIFSSFPPMRPFFLAFLSSLAVSCVSADEALRSHIEFFEKRIRPLLVERCVGCHGEKKQEGELRIDSRTQVLRDLVERGKPEESRLVQVLLYTEDDVQMPPKGKLRAQQISDVYAWIQSGAVWPAESKFGTADAFDSEAWRTHWAFQPIQDPPRPDFGEANWHPVDVFVRRRLHDKGVSASPLADGPVLVRRLSYAVTGLPPDAQDLAAAAAQQDEGGLFQWLVKYTDRLLASPQFGERWGRYWLDISRYADTRGYVFTADREYKEAWKFRDWVIRSLNEDMPYDEFLMRQIAGDQMPGNDDPAQLAAMGFLTLGRRFLNNRHDIIDDRIDVLTRGTMALTVTCARCHDHKFDPIPTADYYSLYGVFDSSQEPGNAPSALRLVDLPKPREPYIFVRGSAARRGDRVSRHFLTALSREAPQPFTQGSGRLELAKKIASRENPLTARVAVNRIWLRLFGRGLVDASSDFGVRTPEPTHPELLDHLSTWFVNHNWSRKALIRYILISYTFLQSSERRPDAEQVDPENRLLARMSRTRLDFEAFRDSLLQVSGQLSSQIGGTSVSITSQPFSNRRTVYARVDRQNLPGVFRTFDFASPDSHSSKRYQTTVPQQALFQFNSPFMLAQAQASSEQCSTSDPNAAVRELYELILLRLPTESEQKAAVNFLETATRLQPNNQMAAGWHYGYGELNDDQTGLQSFHHLPVFQKGAWQGGAKAPDKHLGWCSLRAKGGHPGHNTGLCAVRRWVADRDSQISIQSAAAHNLAKGDGVHLMIYAGQQTLAKEHLLNRRQQLNAGLKNSLTVKAGDVVDFVAFCGPSDSFDSFDWSIRINQSSNGRPVRQWDSQRDFSGIKSEGRVSPLAQLAQVLLMSNEFSFVD